MNQILKTIRDWSEVWGLLIPLIILFIRPHISQLMKPILVYVWVGLVLSLSSTIMFVYHSQMPAFLKNNNLVYNMHSLARVVLFGWFILQFQFGKRNPLPRLLLVLYGVFTVINFTLLTTPLKFSHTHFIAESIILMSLCLIFFFRSIHDETNTNWLKHPAFIVCAGISLFETVNFFTFLFFETLASEQYIGFLRFAWTIHNFSFVLLCIMLAIAFYRDTESQKKPAYAP